MATTGAKYATSWLVADSIWLNYDNAVDTNYTNYAYEGTSSDARPFFLSGFDFSGLPNNATITGFSVVVRGSGTSTSSSRKVTIAEQMFADLVGENFGKAYGKMTSYTTVSELYYHLDTANGFTTATTYTHNSSSNDTAAISWMNQHISDLQSGNFGVRLYCRNSRVYYVTVDLTYTTSVAISTAVSPSGSGTVSGGGSYSSGASVTLTASPSTGYQFKQWQDGNTSNPRTITASSNATYTATFELKSYAISTAVTPSGSGSVSGGGSYTHGSTATLTATPASGYKFKQWQDGNTSNPRTITVTAAGTYTATFELDTVTVSFNASGGSVTTSSKSVSIGGTYGTLPTPTRTGYTFTGWYASQPVYNGGFLRNNDSVALGRTYMHTNKIAVKIDAYEANWADINGKQLISCTEGGGWGIGYGANTVGHGTEIYIDGIGYKGVDFGITSLSSGWHTFDMVFDGSTFYGYVDGTLKGSVATGGTAIKYHSSNGIFIGAEAGSSASTPAGSYYNGSLGSVFIANTNAKLTAVTSSTTVTATAAHTLYAGWRINHYTTSASGTNGTVNGVSSYSSSNPYGETITLTASPSTGYHFVKWENDSTTASRSVTVSADATYTATFALNSYTIYLKDDEGNSIGSVTVNHGSKPVISSTPAKASSGGYVYTFREWNTQRDGSGTSYALNDLPAATASTTYFAQFDATVDEPDITGITITPNPATSGQGYVITVTFST